MININYIEAKADTILKQISSELPIDVIKCANYFNIEVKELELENNISGFFVHKDNSSYIGCNISEGSVRKRFTIAHELGHFLLHYNNDNVIFVSKNKNMSKEVLYNRDLTSSTGENIKEREANAFAAALLMPREKVINKFISYANESLTISVIVCNLASDFNVSEQAMSIRLNKIGLLNPGGF